MKVGEKATLIIPSYLAYGVYTDSTTTFINASTCDRKYNPINPPIIVDLESRDQTIEKQLYGLHL